MRRINKINPPLYLLPSYNIFVILNNSNALKSFFYVFNETSDPPEIIDIFGFSIDPLGAEHCLFLFGILILLESLEDEKVKPKLCLKTFEVTRAKENHGLLFCFKKRFFYKITFVVAEDFKID